eukprot:7101994-Prorocentrum_lima.AAC.1
MTSSLVGSEMCIRDRLYLGAAYRRMMVLQFHKRHWSLLSAVLPDPGLVTPGTWGDRVVQYTT